MAKAYPLWVHAFLTIFTGGMWLLIILLESTAQEVEEEDGGTNE